jgi:mannose-1-phosphate guanylyltransferase
LSGLKIILLSGGSGKRLWPLSNELRSKQFLPLLKRSDGKPESMVKRVWRQLEEAGFSENRYIATGRSQVEVIQSQLGGEIPIIVEPERRDTFPAIALAASYLYSVQGVSLDEVITIMPVDPYVGSSFFEQIRLMEPALRNSEAQLALLGVSPKVPSENFGYIVTKDSLREEYYYSVQSFKEKPRKEEAEALIAQGALWNCGVFAFRLGLIIEILIDLDIPIRYEEMVQQYHELPKNSFDYVVVEKLRSIIVVPYEGEWRDLGTWETLTEEMSDSVYGKGLVTEDCRNTHLVNELEIPVAVIGLSNVVVAASPDGILVSEKSASSRIKELSSLSARRPMYEERRWGFYKIVDFIQYPDGREVLTKRITISAGKNLSYQYHLKRSEVWTILSGEGEMILDDEHFHVHAGDVIKIPRGTKHSIKANTAIEIIEVQSGEVLVEEDIVRLCMKWEEMISFV